MSIIELGGYPDFRPVYEASGYQVVQTDSVRKAVKLIRRHRPEVIVAEFNFQSDFRDRTSSLETLLSSTQGITDARLIVFYEREYAGQYQRFLDRHPVHASLAFPIEREQLVVCWRTSLMQNNNVIARNEVTKQSPALGCQVWGDWPEPPGWRLGYA